MEVSNKGIALIKKFEGCRLTAYQCAAGVWTIGYGHTNGVKEGQTCTQSAADKWLAEDLKAFEKKVAKYNSEYSWNQNQFDALVSFAFNVGSIDQLTAKGTRSVSEISKKILEYNKAGGKVLNGLVERRKAEKALFDEPVKVKSSGSKYVADKFDSKYSDGKKYTVAAKGGLNLREGAGTNTKALKVLPYGSKVTWYGYYSMVNGVKWLYVQTEGGKIGFVSSKYLKG